MRVQAPSGLVFDLPDAVATGLVASEGNGYVFADEAAPPAPKPTAKRPTTRRKAAPRKPAAPKE